MLRQITSRLRRIRSKALPNFDLFNSGGPNKLTELNLVEDDNSSLCLKAEVSLP